MPRRIEQVNSLLQERISRFLLSHFEAPSGALITITKVEVTPDLHSAKVYVSILPENLRGSMLEGLRKIAPEIRQSLYQDLDTHVVPMIIFHIDETEEQAAGIEELLDSLHQAG